MKSRSHNLTRDAAGCRRPFALTLALGLSLVATLVLVGLALLSLDAGSTGAAAGTTDAAGAGAIGATTSMVTVTAAAAGPAGSVEAAGVTSSPPACATSTSSSAISPVSAKLPLPSDSEVVFRCSVQPIGGALAAEMTSSGSWRPGDPVSLADLRLVQISYWGFDEKPHTGSLVVDRTWASNLCDVFHTLYDAHFPLNGMDLIDAYGADDDLSMAADNTSSYNGRRVSGTSVWSMHAYGLAIDINPLENPYIHGGIVSPAAGAVYVDRSNAVPGMIEPGDVVVQAFAAIGWEWGGNWKSCKDYQHFSSNGR